MFIELGGFITCDPRIVRSERGALTVTIGIFTICIPPDTCNDPLLQENIGVIVNGDHTGTFQQMSYSEHSSENRNKQNDPDGRFAPKEIAGWTQQYKDLFLDGSFPSKESHHNNTILASFDTKYAKRLLATMRKFSEIEKLIYDELPAGDHVLMGLRSPGKTINDPKISSETTINQMGD
jgi:hypothetical protein